MGGEQEIMRVRESGRTFKLWLKMLVSLGFYRFAWRSKSWILAGRRLIRHTGVININEGSIPLKNIQDVGYSATLLGAMVNVSRAAEFRNKNVEAVGQFDADERASRVRELVAGRAAR
ncbi:MAG: hypothetical protein AVDCRST_MAG88-2927 [uncultured Thermomicrobiales bacterium]|uniref:YdbS-like PH domain-containing protein n=1 Tax=uncultured Thermomicrobiales bacterium TaxID=1645740 RepID=A0A6J4VEN5_9BACT|nr:MAG: hypothetical protein AVDCRST_MAG88-2927 [uncultured Thermomicrobiales bacterium]